MGVLDGLEVIDLSWGISGPMTTMLLSDHGARVTRIERPGGEPWPTPSGYRVWNRGKRSAVLDLKEIQDRDRVLALMAKADVVVESFSPGKTAELGIDYPTVRDFNPGLVYCSITGYGPVGPDASRPGIDALVAARTGHQWEGRGTTGGTIGRLAGTAGILPGLEAPPGCWVGPDRPGPLFSGVPWISMATGYIASLGINAALRARHFTGRGQHVNASLLHGVLATTIGAWQKVDDPELPNFQSWVIDPRAPKGFFAASDGRWLHHWVPLPEFILSAAENQMRRGEGVHGPKEAGLRVSTRPEDMILLHTYQDQLAEAVGKYPADDWVKLAAEVGVPVQMVRSPEEALLDPLLVADGCVTEVDDPEVGLIRQVGRVIDLARHPAGRPEPAAVRGAHTDEVLAEADTAIGEGPRPSGLPKEDTGDRRSPLDGIIVLDLGLAVAGPFGTQVLAQLGARVIKVNTTRDKFWFSNHIAMCCNRDKESITLNLKDPQAMSVLHRLVERADVVQHNMRYEAAQRLGVDYESLRLVNPELIYCHTIGHEQGPREQMPGNDQTGAALAGTEWLDGGLDHGGRPVWSVTSLGDTGNGFLSALGIIQALMDRDQTGKGQFVRTSILYAHLLNASTAWVSADGARRGDRQEPDAEQYGWNALYRLYSTAEGWLAIAVPDQAAFERLAAAIDRPEVVADPRFDAASRPEHDGDLGEELAATFATRSARDWFDRLDEAGVPCEVSDPDYVLRLFAEDTNPLVSSFVHPTMGRMRMCGLYFDLSDTPGKLWGPPAWPGSNTKQILAEIGYQPAEIEALLARRAADDTSQIP